MAVHSEIEQALASKSPDPSFSLLRTVQRIRQERYFLVQQQAQYHFCYLLLQHLASALLPSS